MADASDSKSDVGDYVWVQVPPSAPSKTIPCGQNNKDKQRLVLFCFFFWSVMPVSLCDDEIT